MNQTTDATAIFAPLWRRKWLILAVAILVAGATYFYYKRATPVFQVATQIYLGSASEEQVPGEKGKVPTPSIGNQAAIINSIVLEGVRQRLRKAHNPAAAKGKVRVKPGTEKSQFITITVEAHQARAAAVLANAIAQAYVRRQREARQRTITTAIAIARRQLRKLEASSVPTGGKPSTSTKSGSPAKTPTPSSPNFGSVLQIANLNTKINQYEAQLSITGAQQIKPAKAANAQKLSPKPRQNAIFGFVIGLVLASIAAYALGRFDRRLRSLESIETAFQAHILAALPTVRRPIVSRDGQRRPSKSLLEPLRRLHTSLQIGTELERAVATHDGRASPRLILFTSPDAGDGKSTLVADLALVQRDAGARVTVVDASFRRPAQDRLLGMDGSRGLAEVLTGTLALDDATQRIPTVTVPHGGGSAPAGVATAVDSRDAGSLSLLANGGQVANPPALLAGESMKHVLDWLREEGEYVLIDAPSPLEVSDVMPLLAVVDGIVIVARAGHTREMSAQRLVQLLADTPGAPVLGVAANCVAQKDVQRYGFSGRVGWPWRRKLTRR